MDLRQLRQFVTLAEAGSFSLAAERLHMAQPPLSVAIRKLEEEVGTALFVRGARGVRLTAAGAAVLAPARQSLAAAARVRELAQSAAAGLSGVLRVGFSGSVTVRLLPRVVQAFAELYPSVRLELREGTNLELLGMVENEALDVGLVRVPASRPPQLSFQLIERDTFCVALPRGHALARKQRIRLADLDGQPFIGYVPSPVGGLHAAASQLLQRAGVAPVLAQEAVQVQTVLGLVASGLGVALVPAVNTPFQQLSGAVFRPIADLPKDFYIGIALAYKRGNDNPVMMHFLEQSERSAADQTEVLVPQM